MLERSRSCSAAASPRNCSSAEVSTGASNDFERATKLARGMVIIRHVRPAWHHGLHDEDASGFGMQNKTISRPPSRRSIPRSAASSTNNMPLRGRSSRRSAGWSKNDDRGAAQSGRPSIPSRSRRSPEGRAPNPPAGWVQTEGQGQFVHPDRAGDGGSHAADLMPRCAAPPQQAGFVPASCVQIALAEWRGNDPLDLQVGEHRACSRTKSTGCMRVVAGVADVDREKVDPGRMWQTSCGCSNGSRRAPRHRRAAFRMPAAAVERASPKRSM